MLVVSFANNFFQSMGCLFVLFVVSFAVQKLVLLEIFDSRHHLLFLYSFFF